jgi:radical SAM superfamily enzyme YgiQ (UPF0313 family)
MIILLQCFRKNWPHRLAWSRTDGSQPLNTGSNPVGATKVFSVSRGVEILGNKAKEIVFVDPPVGNIVIRSALFLYTRQQIPLWQLILSALSPPQYRIKCYHQKIWWPKNNFLPGVLVGIRCITINSYAAYRLADKFRQAGAFVVMGGPHASCLPEEALRHCDSVVIGEAESVWPQVVKDFEQGSLKKIYKGNPLDDFFYPVKDYFLKLDPRVLLRSGIAITRGCKYHCDFCARPEGRARYMKTGDVAALIERMKGGAKNAFIKRPTFIFQSENNIFSDPMRAKDIFRALIPLKIKWLSPCSIDIAFDEEALQLAKDSGCRRLFIGFETVYPARFQKTADQGMLSLDDYSRAVKKIKSYGIGIVASFIVGIDGLTHLDYWRLLLFFLRTRFFFVAITLLTPFPGTDLFRRLLQEGRLKTQRWDRYDLLFNIVFEPRGMSVLSLTAWFLLIRVVSFLSSANGIQLIFLVFFLNKFGYLLGYGIAKYLSGIFFK